MTAFVVIVIGWVILFLLIALFNTWYHSYRNPIEWWYHNIDTSPKAGIWYYGNADAARRRVRQPQSGTDPWYDPSEPHKRRK